MDVVPSRHYRTESASIHDTCPTLNRYLNTTSAPCTDCKTSNPDWMNNNQLFLKYTKNPAYARFVFRSVCFNTSLND